MKSKFIYVVFVLLLVAYLSRAQEFEQFTNRVVFDNIRTSDSVGRDGFACLYWTITNLTSPALIFGELQVDRTDAEPSFAEIYLSVLFVVYERASFVESVRKETLERSYLWIEARPLVDGPVVLGPTSSIAVRVGAYIPTEPILLPGEYVVAAFPTVTILPKTSITTSFRGNFLGTNDPVGALVSHSKIENFDPAFRLVTRDIISSPERPNLSIEWIPIELEENQFTESLILRWEQKFLGWEIQRAVLDGAFLWRFDEMTVEEEVPQPSLAIEYPLISRLARPIQEVHEVGRLWRLIYTGRLPEALEAVTNDIPVWAAFQ